MVWVTLLETTVSRYLVRAIDGNIAVLIRRTITEDVLVGRCKTVVDDFGNVESRPVGVGIPNNLWAHYNAVGV